VASVKVDVCSQNPGKLSKFRAIRPDWEIELLDAGELPPEDGATYLDNARIKARYGRGAARSDRWVLADDSGIEVAALGQRPGVETARWAEGRHVEKLLLALAGRADRRARYVCELVCVSPEGEEFRGTGLLAGTVSTARSGSQGFGFDPVFVPVGETETVAELGDDWKASHSHRALAVEALVVELGGRA
jgi:XTP/dITP diphosphohydrolase